MIGALRAVAKLSLGLTLALALATPGTLAAPSSGPKAGAAEPAHLGATGPVWPTQSGTERKEVQVVTLEATLERAAGHHPEIRKAKEAVASAERELQAQDAAYAPRLSLSSTPVSLQLRQGELRRQDATLGLSASKSTPSGLSGSASVNLRVDENFELSLPTWNVGLSYPLFRSLELNSTNMAIRQAQIALEAAERNLAQTEATAVVQSIQLYHAAYRSGIRLQEAQQRLTQTEEQTAAVRRQVELGIASEVDRLEAEAELRRQQLAAIQAERSFDEQMAALLEAMGLDDASGAFALAGWPFLLRPQVGKGDVAAWRSLARELDANLWQRAVAIQSAELQLQAELERSRIESNLSAGVGKVQETSTSPPTTRWSLQVQLSYPLADGGARRRAVEDRERSLEEAEAAYKGELKAFEARMQRLVDELHDARIRFEIAQLTYEKAQIEFTSAQAAYAAGMSSAQAFWQAERSLQGTNDELQGAVLDLHVAVWNLQIAAGMRPDLTALFAN